MGWIEVEAFWLFCPDFADELVWREALEGLQSSAEVDYDFIDVAGHSYLLPARSEAHMERSYRHIANVVTFTGYRKFEAESTIDFKPAGN